MHRSRANSSIYWRCSSNGCLASVITNFYQTDITRKNKHIGKHPVTLRSLTSSPIASSATSKQMTSPISTTVRRATATPTPSSPVSVVHTPDPAVTACHTPSLYDTLSKLNTLTDQNKCLVSLLQTITLVLDRQLTKHFTNTVSSKFDVLDPEEKLLTLSTFIKDKIARLEKEN